ncbi:MAG: EFR1 family ferrodoxin [Lachnospiraceae bacterium]|nr:EFR1 family ferrodoxin [Lachnospiraceae bacterium]
MVLYFSATGNTEFIAKELAKQIDDEVMNLLPRIKANDTSEIYSERPFVICSPIYVCEMPRFFAKFIEQLELTGSRDVYFVFTSGGYAGIAAALGRKIATRKGMNYRGRVEFRMPRNYPLSRRYPLLPEEQNIERIKESYEHVPEVAAQIKNGERIKLRRLTYFEKIITYPFNPIWVKHKHTAKPFYSTDACIGCGKCARLCPLNNITIVDKRPVWNDSCAHCMACMSNCPVEAIEYGKITQGQYKYRLDKYWKE